ncbi:MAG: hypothetical protein ABIG20_02045 [archaeon]
MIPSLIVMGALDLIAGLFMLSLQYRNGFEAMFFSAPYWFVFYLGVAIMIKGAYSVAYGAFGKGW